MEVSMAKSNDRLFGEMSHEERLVHRDVLDAGYRRVVDVALFSRARVDDLALRAVAILTPHAVRLPCGAS